jgi:adenylylsulfate kinase
MQQVEHVGPGGIIDKANSAVNLVCAVQRREDAMRGTVVWFTGLSGAGKTTLATALARNLHAAGRRVEILDGDEMREHICAGLGFSREDRDRNVQRIAVIANLLARNGVTVAVAAISPYRSSRETARRLIGGFIEVHVAAPLDVCIARDVKSLYAKALAGELKHFSGVSDPYEAPENPELRLDTSNLTVDEAVARIVALLGRDVDAPPCAIDERRDGDLER